MKNLAILGSTGSIGINSIKVVQMFPDRFRVKSLAAGNNVEVLAKQIIELKPDIVVVYDKERAAQLRNLLPLGLSVKIKTGEKGYMEAASYGPVDTVISAIVGSAGLMPTIAAIDAGKDIALANKETLVMAGEFIMRKAKSKGINILPVDSEHSAIFQCLLGQHKKDLKKILLTASGGPFRKRLKDTFDSITPADALNHPTWNMGRKISIDSATLMNKGFEVIEAKWLFDVCQDKIEVLIHPQSIIHSMVAFIDGSVIAQLGVTDMKCAIAYAISYPQRLPIKQELLDFVNIGGLTFEHPDITKFPCLKLAYEASMEGKTMPAVLNAANEVAVYSFLKDYISFEKIPEIISKAMDKHTVCSMPNIEDIIEADRWARETATDLLV
mmetsp:Transcript_27625/g.12861  ORF Transcript_27625/g.12861 Transcript_27625/m.12861 type:complete len:384 (-) Transcript_27625:1739-2890(-)|eukprot:CAMPEP_0201283036 /NCGR_PEP_ID=MMETSP1317-20130820/7378_1 /ASSEMBLY_ACC=CAM_ASM_000770 /TAXON_ID=187299 /ORGANISM="Undescribed Undescribed, Strain Undescribed" /LENGTH=383 /DNA_ID=CAMNT_0047597803 /DNA_START=239 /DNA_END=1390 /DNA_ORIENTATION=-